MTGRDSTPAGGATRPAALITGAAGGIGRAVALALAEAGFALALNGLDGDDGLDDAVAAVAETGVPAIAVRGDIAAIGGHERLLDAAELAVGPLTTLVNNAGVSVLSRGDLLAVTPESFDRCHAINTRGTFFLTQAFARRLVARPRPAALHHAIVTVSSSNARAVSVARGEYCVSKAGLAMASQLFAVRLAPEGIGAYDVQPGIIDTPMTAVVRDDYTRRIAEGLTPAPRMGQPEDIAEIVVALATGRLAFATGQTIQADGGLTIPRF
ncbi:NAD(P)-dependent dehydrogenase, short-chain alcohol dehydrogenase family [Pseudoxanthobacter soli DSM 19599]|uniref:NAD(P)-dependent dehydrogenase, short-chain alcohol dehydrogenase family n=1 Tax=Pseudoxanthobacter soli DSM 19599 TaxID=1123029 RepID=A0A1M7ZN95_9HYPH|nr:3-ketoacyl-ACP reductase [Pseudoxanthobacter soli]SHO66351.1 NAD(P)-dependent dehydrogenase, short-chain alcohol dehydrogenase family [Pseudoxanthobacter soli DSM 19599]